MYISLCIYCNAIRYAVGQPDPRRGTDVRARRGGAAAAPARGGAARGVAPRRTTVGGWPRGGPRSAGLDARDAEPREEGSEL